MKRFIVCTLALSFTWAAIIVSYAEIRNQFFLHDGRESMSTTVAWLTAAVVVMHCGTFVFAIVFTAGRPIPASIFLSRGQIFRLIAVSKKIDDNGLVAVLLEVSVDKVRHVLIWLDTGQRESFDRGDVLVPGHYYSYKGWGQIQVAPIGKL